MTAADVLADQYFLGEPGFNAEGQAAALLAHGNGQGVAILPDGTLWALVKIPGIVKGFRLVPAGDTDGP